MKQKISRRIILGMAACSLLAGCGGGSRPSSNTRAGQVVLTVAWPSRSRLIPAASNSIKATLSGGGVPVSQTLVITRPQTTVTFSQVPPGALTLTATAYPSTNGTGVAQALGNAPVTVQDGQTANVTVTMDSTIDHVDVTPLAPSIAVGDSIALTATAKDVSGNIVLLSPGKLQWTSQTSTVASVDGAGHAAGLTEGTSNITAKDLESGKSGSVLLTVSAAFVTISPNAVSLLINGEQVFVGVAAQPLDPSVVYSVDEGAAGGVIDANGIYIAPPTPGTYHVTATSRYDPTHKATATITVSALTNSNFVGLYVNDYYNNRIIRMDDLSGANWHAFAGFAAAGGYRFSGIQRLALDSIGRIYITDWVSNRITRMDDITGKNLVTFGTLGSGVGQFNQPLAISIGPDGKIYVADYQNNRIVRMNDMTGSGWTTYGTAGTGVGQFTFLQGIWITGDGRIYIADTFNNRIARIDDMTGAGWTSFGIGVAPTSVAVDGSGRIYFSDYYNNRIGTALNMSGSGLTFLGSTSPGSGVGQFRSPSPIYIGSDGKIYVTDSGNDRVIRMNDITGAGWTTFGSHGPGIGQFAAPLGIVLSP
jgi:streptogramin lyase